MIQSILDRLKTNGATEHILKQFFTLGKSTPKIGVKKITWDLLDSQSENVIVESVENSTSCKRVTTSTKKKAGKKVNGVFRTFEELDEQKRLKKIEASKALTIASSYNNVTTNGTLISYKRSLDDYKKENLVPRKQRLNVHTLEITPDGTKIESPMATFEELVALQKGKALPKNSILR